MTYQHHEFSLQDVHFDHAVKASFVRFLPCTLVSILAYCALCKEVTMQGPHLRSEERRSKPLRGVIWYIICSSSVWEMSLLSFTYLFNNLLHQCAFIHFYFVLQMEYHLILLLQLFSLFLWQLFQRLSCPFDIPLHCTLFGKKK